MYMYKRNIHVHVHQAVRDCHKKNLCIFGPPCTKNRGHKPLTTKFSPYFLPPTNTYTHAHARTLTHTFVHTQNQFFVHVFAMTPDKKEHRFLLPAQPRDTPAGLLDIALKRFNRAQGIEEHSPDDYVLKVRGEISTLC